MKPAFLLDHNVSALVKAKLLSRGFDCVTASEAGLHNATDNQLAVYADDRGLVLLSHDREFFRRRLGGVRFGRHVLLAVKEFDAADVIDDQLDELVQCLRVNPVAIRVRRKSVTIVGG